MCCWRRVFGITDTQPEPAALANGLQPVAPSLRVHAVKAGERGWHRTEIQWAGGATPLVVERFWRDEEGIREELQAWAAWVETCADNPHHERLMQHLTSTQQVFTLRSVPEHHDAGGLDHVCQAICQYLARVTDGVYQVDQQGFFDRDGTLLLPESE
jgi:hypothetical protein